MKPEIVFATGNEGKMKEIREIMADMDCTILSMKEAGIDLDIVEDGTTFEENAVIKAQAVAQACGKIVLADDSGLEIDYLDGAPGIYSARYMGEDTPYTEKNAALIRQLDGVEDAQRSARFVCVIAAATPDGEVLTADGVIDGRIAYEASGDHGFGYDPIFYVPEFGKTTAEMSDQEKNAVSHRGKALQKMKALLQEKGLIGRKEL